MATPMVKVYARISVSRTLGRGIVVRLTRATTCFRGITAVGSRGPTSRLATGFSKGATRTTRLARGIFTTRPTAAELANAASSSLRKGSLGQDGRGRGARSGSTCPAKGSLSFLAPLISGGRGHAQATAKVTAAASG